jgi:hypothetical protein
LDWRSIPRTVSCFDGALVGLPGAAFGVVTLDTDFDRVALRFPADDRAGRNCLTVRFVNLDLLLAIWLSLWSSTASSSATGTSPAIPQGEQESQGLKPRMFNGEVTSCKFSGILDQLLDIRRNRRALRNAVRARAGFRSPCDPRRLARAGTDLREAGSNGFVDYRAVYAVFPCNG